MGNSLPKFDQITEYARYGGIEKNRLRRKVATFYPGDLEVVLVDDSLEIYQTASKYSVKVRGFLYHHGFRYKGKTRESLMAQHIISKNAFRKLESIIGDSANVVINVYTTLARFLNHDILHGFNGAAENFGQFDEQLVFGGVEFFPLMTHSEVFEQWMQRDANGDFILAIGRFYIDTLAPIAQEYNKTKDPEILKLLDYFVLIYQKCLLTLLPLKNEVALKFNGRAQKTLYSDFPPSKMIRTRCESILGAGLEAAGIKNNPTLLSDSDYNRKETGAAKAGIKFLDNIFEDGGEVAEDFRMVKLTAENLIMGGCFRMVPNMDRPTDLQNSFHDIYIT